MRIDPYHIKRLRKTSLKRLAYTLAARSQEQYSRFFFEEFAYPFREVDDLPLAPDADWSQTQVTPLQAQYLLKFLVQQHDAPGCVIEVGSWRGVTTEWMSKATSKTVVAIDPWIGDLNDVNFQAFRARTESLTNVVVDRKPFGAAVSAWAHGPACFAFIDAAHDYANVAHDLAAVRSIIAPAGVIALHDTDNLACAGCRRAVHEKLEDFQLMAHIENLTILMCKA